MTRRRPAKSPVQSLVTCGSFLIIVFLVVKKLMAWMQEWESRSQASEGVLGELKSGFERIEKVGEARLAGQKLPVKKANTVKYKARPAAAPALNLNSRQEKIYSMLRQRGSVTMSAIAGTFLQVSSRTLRRDLTQLETLGLVTQSGKTKNSSYHLVKV